MRKIVHIDMDAFYASIEQRDFPEYRGKPVVVGGSPNSRGVVAACSYEARDYGIHSAMSSAMAYRACPHAVFVKPRFDVYREVSRQVQDIFKTFTSLVEPLSLDEAYLDVTDAILCSGSATLIAKKIKVAIRQQTNLTASAGISYNKFLAKIASDMDKPDGLYVIKPGQGEAFVGQLPIGRFFGIGKATEAKMHKLNIYTGADLKSRSLEELLYEFGKVGRFYYSIARGVDERTVNAERVRKSISKETTFVEDQGNVESMLEVLFKLAEQVSDVLRQKHLSAKTLVIKVKYDNFEQVTRSKTLFAPVASLAGMSEDIKALLSRTQAGSRRVRLLGVGVSNLQFKDAPDSVSQIELFKHESV